MSMDKTPLIVITGPTATGKTETGAALCRILNGEVISADSMQVYRGMDIGTAKPTPEERQGVPHHMIDVAGPEEPYSVDRWTRAASRAADGILARGLVPVVVGGTGLYIDSLLAGREFGAAPGDSGLRERLEAEYAALGPGAMLERLRAVDPERAGRLAPGDKKRVLRALEVYLLTGETITEHDRRSRAQPPRYQSRRFALTWRERETLYRRIDGRVDQMVDRGLFQEVRSLLEAGISPRATSMQAIGYKEVAAALRGECSPQQAVEAVKRESRRYAKRQLTWLRRDPGLVWLFREDFPSRESLLAGILERLRQDPTEFSGSRI